MLQTVSIPYGHNLLNGQLIEEAHEQRVIANLEIWYASGVSYDDMADKLNNLNIPTKRNAVWKGATISRILARERGSQ